MLDRCSSCYKCRLLDAAYAYPGGWISDRLGSRRALLLFGALTIAGFAVYLVTSSISGVFAGLFLVAAWSSLGLPATFAFIGEKLAGSRRIVGFTLQSALRRLPMVIAPPVGFVSLFGAYVIGGLREIGEPARKALIVDLSAAGARGKTVGLYYSIRGFAVAGAAIAGGALWSIRPAFTFYAAAAIGCAGTLWAFVTLPFQASEPEKIPS